MRRPNRVGCIPSGEVCLAHDEPLWCRHGCSCAFDHKCKNWKISMIEEVARIERDSAKSAMEEDKG